MNEASLYRLSVFEPVKILSSSERSEVTLVKNILNDSVYIKKQYNYDVAAIYQEIRNITHSNLPKIYEVIKLDKQVVVIEEYIEGCSLSDFISQNKVIPLKLAINIGHQIASAVNELHKKGIIHRDIKPSNIIIKNNNSAVLIDFDIARKYNTDAYKDTKLLGSEAYAPPEQFGFSQTDFRSDIFSFGITLNEILTGKLPSKQICKGSISKIVKKCIEFDPNRRYQSFTEVIHDLGRIRKPYKKILAILIIGSIIISLLVFLPKMLKTIIGNIAYQDQVQSVLTPPLINQQDSSAIEAEPKQNAGTNNIADANENAPQVNRIDFVNDLSNADSDDSIFKVSNQSDLKAVNIFADGTKTANIDLDGNKLDEEFKFTKNKDTLVIHAQDLKNHEKTLTFKAFTNVKVFDYEDSPEMKFDYEVLFNDFDGDEIAELLVGVSKRRVLIGPRGDQFYNVMYTTAWIIRYSPTEGFEQCDGFIESRTAIDCSLPKLITVNNNPFEGYKLDHNKIKFYTY